MHYGLFDRLAHRFLYWLNEVLERRSERHWNERDERMGEGRKP